MTETDPLAPPTDADLTEEQKTQDAFEALNTEDETLPETVAPVPASYGSITVKELTEYLAGHDRTPADGAKKRDLYDAYLGYFPDAQPERHPDAIPETYTVGEERSYIDIARKFGFDNYIELAGYNGVFNSRYELAEGDVVKLPQLARAE